jgi:hypothetical protein
VTEREPRAEPFRDPVGAAATRLTLCLRGLPVGIHSGGIMKITFNLSTYPFLRSVSIL